MVKVRVLNFFVEFYLIGKLNLFICVWKVIYRFDLIWEVFYVYNLRVVLVKFIMIK